MKIDLIRIFAFNPSLKYVDLGIGCLTAYLRQNGMKVNFQRIELEHKGIAEITDFSQAGYFFESWSLPLTLAMIRNDGEGKPLHYGMESVLRKYYKKGLVSPRIAARSIKDNCARLQKALKLHRNSKAVGFKADCSNAMYVIAASLLLRKMNPGVKIIYGGPQVSLDYDYSKLALRAGIADIVVIGEGEKPLLAIARDLKAGGSGAVEGTLTYNRSAALFMMNHPKSLVNLDELPFPDISDQVMKGETELKLHANRGCIFFCHFCSYPGVLNRFRQMSPERAVEMIADLYKKHKMRSLMLNDNAINYSLEWLERFAEEMKKRGPGCKWTARFSPARPVTAALAQSLKEAGLDTVIIGGESLSGRTLKKMNRPCGAKETLAMINTFASLGFRTQVNFIAGFPGESERDYAQTLRAIRELMEKYENFAANINYFRITMNSYCCLYPQRFGASIVRADSLAELAGRLKHTVSGTPLYFNLPDNKAGVKRFREMKFACGASRFFYEKGAVRGLIAKIKRGAKAADKKLRRKK